MGYSAMRDRSLCGRWSFYILAAHFSRRMAGVWVLALSRGERVSRSGAFTSRSVTGEGSLAQFGATRVSLFRSVLGAKEYPVSEGETPR